MSNNDNDPALQEIRSQKFLLEATLGDLIIRTLWVADSYGVVAINTWSDSSPCTGPEETKNTRTVLGMLLWTDFASDVVHSCGASHTRKAVSHSRMSWLPTLCILISLPIDF